MLIKMLKETKRFGFSSCVVAKNIYNNICHCCLSSIQFALAHPQLRKAVLHRHRQQESQVSHGLLLVREVHHGKVTLSRHVTLLLWCPLVVVLASPNTSSAIISRHALFVARSSSSWPVQTLQVQRIYYIRLAEHDVGVIRPCSLCCTFVVVLASSNTSSLVEQDPGIITPCSLCCTLIVVLASPNASYLLDLSGRARHRRNHTIFPCSLSSWPVQTL